MYIYEEVYIYTYMNVTKSGLLSGLQIQRQVSCQTNQALMVHLHVSSVLTVCAVMP